MQDYTFYSARWATQKGDIFAIFWGVCAKSGPVGGGHFQIFTCVVAHLKWPTWVKKGGDIFFGFRAIFFLFYSARGTWLSRFCLGSQVLLFIICTYIVAVAFLKKIDSLKVNRMLALINLNRHLLKVFSKISTVGTVSFFTRVLCILKNVITKK